MALDCLGTGGNRERLDLVDNSALDLASSGWTIFAMFFPSTAVGINTFAYIYAHAAPLANVSAINIFLVASTSKARVIIDQPGGNLADFSSSNSIVANEWNAIAVRLVGVNVIIHLNGVQTSASPPAIGNLVPIGNARIGDATHGPGREFNGRICEAAKWDDSLSGDLLDNLTSNLLSPLFVPTPVWHTPIYNGSFNDDVMGAVTTTPVGALYGDHAPALYPEDEDYVSTLDSVITGGVDRICETGI